MKMVDQCAKPDKTERRGKHGNTALHAWQQGLALKGSIDGPQITEV